MYPLSIDSERSRDQGRKVPLDCACRKPEVGLMEAACRALGFPSLVEPGKRHPRDFLRPGRIRVQLRLPDDSFAKPNITSRRKLVRAAASTTSDSHISFFVVQLMRRCCVSLCWQLQAIGKIIPTLPGYNEYLNAPPRPILGIDKDMSKAAQPQSGGGGKGKQNSSENKKKAKRGKGKKKK